MAIDPAQVGEWLKDGAEAIGLLRSAQALLPNGPKRDAITAKIEEAELALALSNATAAKTLGYELCQCTFPPQIMLWREAERSRACPACDRKIGVPADRAPGAACPVCGELEFRTEKTSPHPKFGRLGAVNRHLKCGACGHTETQLETPK